MNEPVRWPDVLRVLQDDENRSWAMTRFKSSGFSADSFATKTKARQGMADTLTALEDWLELELPKRWRRDGPAIRAVRRRLELELWP